MATLTISGSIVLGNGSSLFWTDRNTQLQVFKPSWYDITKVVKTEDLKLFMVGKGIPQRYLESVPTCNQMLVDQLTSQQPRIDHDVRLKEGESPCWGLLYMMSREEMLFMKEWLEENMTKGCVLQSCLRFMAPWVLAKKPDGGLRYCINHSDMRGKMITNSYWLLLVRDTLNLLAEAKIYTKFGVWGWYNLVMVTEAADHRLSFRTW